jgi:hypothetical protein
MCKQTLSAVLNHNRKNFWPALVLFCYQVSATCMKRFVSLCIARIALVSLSSPTVSPVSLVSPRVKPVSYRYRAMNIRNIDFWPSLSFVPQLREFPVGKVRAGRVSSRHCPRLDRRLSFESINKNNQTRTWISMCL